MKSKRRARQKPGGKEQPELGEVEKDRMGELLERKFKEVDGYLKKRLGPSSEGLTDNLREGLKGFNRPYDILSDVFECMRVFEDDNRLHDFVGGVANRFLPMVRLKSRRAGIRDASLLVHRLSDCSGDVPEKYRLLFWYNMGIPLMRVFRDSVNGYEKALRGINSVPAGKYTEWSRRGIYGRELGGGVYGLLDTIPDVEQRDSLITTLAFILENISNPKRRTFMRENGPQLFIALGKLPLEDRYSSFEALLKVDSRFNNWGMPCWEFLRLHGAELINRKEVLSSPEPQKKVLELGESMYNTFVRDMKAANSGFKHEPIVITSPDQIRPEYFERLKAEVADGGKWIDVIVHPNTAEDWIDKGTRRFKGVLTRNTGRTVEDYELHKRHLNDLLRSEHRLKVILCDVRLVEKTRAWVEESKPKNSVIIIPTRETTADGSATPRSSDLSELLAHLNATWFNGVGIRYEKAIVGGDPWTPLGELFKRLGVHGLRLAGEYAMARLIDGRPTIDSEGNMNLIAGCVAGVRRNMLPKFEVSVLGSACFPASTVLPPAKGSLMEEERISKSIYRKLPSETRGDIKAICGNSYWSLIALQEAYHILGTEGAVKNAGRKRGEMESHIRELSREPVTNISNLFIKALILSRDIPEMPLRIEGVNEALRNLVGIKKAAPSFAMDPLTARMLDESASLAELNDTLRTADTRLGDVKSVFGRLMPRLGAVTSRLLSPARTDDESFYSELGRYRRLLTSLKSPEVHIPPDHKLDVTASLINYMEELRGWVREAVLDGPILYTEAGGDLTSLAVMARTEPFAKPAGWRKPRLTWLSASESELRGGKSLIRILGFERVEEVTGSVVAVTPVSREAKKVIAVGSKVGGPHIQQRLEAGHKLDEPIGRSIGHSLWQYETRAILAENMDAVQGHSTDPTPLLEYLSGTCPDALILKGFETWIFDPRKHRPLAQDSPHIPDLFNTLNGLTALIPPSGRVLVSAYDPNVIRYFRLHPDFLQMETPPNVRVIQDDYPQTDVPPIKIRVRPQQDSIDGVKLADTSHFLVDELVLLPKADFTLFQRKGGRHMPESLGEMINQFIVSQRGKPHYIKELREAESRTRRESILHCRRKTPAPGKPPHETLYVHEEEMKTDLMFKALVNSRIIKHRPRGGGKIIAEALRQIEDGYKRGDPDKIVERGLRRHPGLWMRYRTLSERRGRGEYRPIPQLRRQELDDLGHQIAVQTIIEEMYHGRSIPSPTPSWRHDIEPHMVAEPKEEVMEEELLPEPGAAEKLRASIYERLGIVP